ncbi:tRNA endonuclease ANKZF1 isoform X3 [Struthio camelus]|uniref:tRNA endonuclease ANKZF1 isoform X3 n=1 Tax=Struthio camelus TaxID=8801 RepID=UPI0036040217
MPAPENRSIFEAAQDPAFVYGLSLVTGFSVDASVTDPRPVNHEKRAAAGGEERAHGVPEVPERMYCLTCAQAFDSREEQTEHYRLDWHRFNLKQRLLGRPALPAEGFEEKTCAGDVSSISGSDLESSDSSSESQSLPPVSNSAETSQVLRSHKVLFRNGKGQLISAYRCVLGTGKGGSEEPAELVASLQSLSASTCWVVLMMGGGHFAGAVFQGPQLQEHKTFHRYTVRARRGTSQSLRDAQTPAAAPRISRTCWQAGRTTYGKLGASSSGPLATTGRCSLAAGTLLSPRVTPVSATSHSAPAGPPCGRCCESTLCWPACRCTDTPLEEITRSPQKGLQKGRRAAEMDVVREDMTGPALSPRSAPEEEEEEESLAGKLETVEVTLGTLDLREFEVIPKRNRKRRRKRDKKVEKGSCAEEIGSLELSTEPQREAGAEPLSWSNGGDTQTQLRDALFTACKTGDVGTLRHLLGVLDNGTSPGDSEGEKEAVLCSLLNQPVDERGCTLLHVAACAGKAEAVYLLLEAGADPALRDRQEQPPYCVSADKPTRNAFRKFVVDHPDKYDYSRAKVPGPLTPEMEAKKLEKKRAQKAQRKQREQVQREERQRWEQEQEEKQRFAALSDREKRALAAERRLAAQLQDTGTTLANISRCWHCGESLLGRIPFHYLDFSFCSTACLQTHRRARASHT